MYICMSAIHCDKMYMEQVYWPHIMFYYCVVLVTVIFIFIEKLPPAPPPPPPELFCFTEHVEKPTPISPEQPSVA